MKKGTLFSLAAALVISLGALPQNATPTQAEDSRTFPQTGKTVSGLFLRYWDTHGALAQQGYPITEQMQERSDTDGKMYSMQYFQRAVFEMHPEYAGTNSEVLLSLLGTFFYEDRYTNPGGAPGQRVNTKNPRKFTQTGKTIGGAFRTYWEQHGGLAQQGYPISEEFQEVSRTNGETYTVQYFQRAIFELHTELAPPNNVLLSLVGVFYRDKKQGMVGTPVPTMPPTAIVPPTPTPPDNSGQVLLYNSTTGGASICRVDPDGSLQSLKLYSPTEFNAGWSRVVALGGGRVLFYNDGNGLTTVGQIATDGTYTNTRSVFTLGAGWSHIARAGADMIFYYLHGTGKGGTARVNPDGSLTLLRSYTNLNNDMWVITGLDNGVLVYHEYSTNDGGTFWVTGEATIGKDGLVEAGTMVPLKPFRESFDSRWWSQIAAGTVDKALFYKTRSNKSIAATARFAADGTYTLLEAYPGTGNPPLPVYMPYVAALSNGSLFFYDSATRAGMTARFVFDGRITIQKHLPAGSLATWTSVVGIK